MGDQWTFTGDGRLYHSGTRRWYRWTGSWWAHDDPDEPGPDGGVPALVPVAPDGDGAMELLQ